MNFDYAIHSDFLIHWTGKDIDCLYGQKWYDSDKSKTSNNFNVCDRYIKRLHDTLKYGLWMTVEDKNSLRFGNVSVSVPSNPQTCFTELKVS